jgi:hypothetical protein
MDIFTNTNISLSGGKILPLTKCWISLASIDHICKAILAKEELLKKSNLVRDRVFSEGYNVLVCKNKSVVSVSTLAKTILDIFERYKYCDFYTMTQNNVRTQLTQNEMEITLENANLYLIVKTLRLCLINLVKNFFPKIKDSQKWISSNAVYMYGGIERTSAVYVEFVNELMKVYNSLMKLSPSLDECKKVIENGIKLGKEEGLNKRNTKIKEKMLNKNYKKTVQTQTAVITTAATAKAVAKATVLTPPVDKKEKQPLVNVWKTSNESLIEKLVSTGIVKSEPPQPDILEQLEQPEQPDPPEQVLLDDTTWTLKSKKYRQKSKK